jgi:two-component system KDP operon response regulator KdpE
VARPAEVVTIGRCRIDLIARTVIRRGSQTPAPETVRLSPAEWQLLEILLRSPGQLIASGRLLAALQAAGFDSTANDLRFHMAGLRQKLEEDPPRPRHLLTEPGMGYRYRP